MLQSVKKKYEQLQNLKEIKSISLETQKLVINGLLNEKDIAVIPAGKMVI